ncbi:MAG: flagellar biosynthesis protein FlhA, partial [Planctomycetaceae bacterium]|nr:flagellar biosynthesis protein FlhA [Planctomycetaceae bacterium]
AAKTTARSARAASLELLFPMLLCASVLVIVAPLPAMLMDLLLAANITISVLILLATITVRRPLEFSVFPAILLATTLSRLVLNVASTRLILSRGAIDGELAAGGVIQAFGDFVAGGQVLIGLVIFAIIVAIQFLVITKGATRISEVAARFALDGMSGRQTAIDADLNAGAITPLEARNKREELARYADFYGAMDGASKFVRGDAIAGLLITLINIVGGLTIGVFQHGMEIGQAFEVFTKLTIGDGLVTQVPAFLISLAAGLIVTRGSTESQLSTDVVTQVFQHPEALGIAACLLVGLAFTGLPALPLLALAAGCGMLAWSTSGNVRPTQRHPEPTAPKSSTTETQFEEQLTIHPLELELGFGLIRLVNTSQGGDLLDRVNRLRQKLVQDQGLILPAVHIRDNMRLKQFQYRIKLRDVPIAHGEAYPDRCLAVNTGDTTGTVQGIRGIDPAFQHPGVWIDAAEREQALQFGYRIVEAAPVVIAHLNEMIRRHGDELLSQQQVHELLQRLKAHSPRVVDDVIPSLLTVSQVHQILMNLLREHVSIRPLETILETLAAHAAESQDVTILTERVRISLRRNICQQYRDTRNVLRCVSLDPQLEDWLLTGLTRADHNSLHHSLRLAPPIVDALTQSLDAELTPLTSAGQHPVILCSSPLRPGLRQLLAPLLPSVVCLSLNEITADTRVQIQGRVSLDVVQDAAFAAK